MSQVECRADWLDGLNNMERSQEACRRVERNCDAKKGGSGSFIRGTNKYSEGVHSSEDQKALALWESVQLVPESLEFVLYKEVFYSVWRVQRTL